MTLCAEEEDSRAALGYDWIYDTLTDAERRSLVQALMDKGLWGMSPCSSSINFK